MKMQKNKNHKKKLSYLLMGVLLLILGYITLTFLARPFVSNGACCTPSSEQGVFRSGDQMFAISLYILPVYQLKRGDSVIHSGYDFNTQKKSNTLLGMIEGIRGDRNDVDDSSVVNPYIRNDEYIIRGANGERDIIQKKDIHYLIWYPKN